jgi:hypothetical protein
MSNYKMCAGCGNEFTGHKNRRFCSNDCYFWSFVDKSGGEDACWPWTGHLNKTSGYGSVNAYTAGERTYAHRHAYTLAVGDPGELFVLHKCDNRPCCNPRHLVAGTAWDNWWDAISKGRPMAITPKLTTAEVVAIRRSGARVRDLVRQFKVADTTIRAVQRRETWRHVTD